jgi:hypothetical protein
MIDMTKAMEWLKTKAPGFNHLTQEEVDAITDFSLLWSLFESRILNRNANARALCNAVEDWRDSGTLVPDLFDEELAYFSQRYHPDDTFSHHFAGLRLQPADREPMVRRVLAGTENDAGHRLAAALIIVYRYRNNLFHGEKWEYELADQLGNFTASNSLLMKTLERYGNF